MIVDKIDLAFLYAGLGGRFKKAFDFLIQTDFSHTPVGRYEIDGSDLFYLVQEYQTLPLEKSAFEAHRLYADIQFIVSGREKIGYAPLNESMQETVAYNPEKDIAKYDGNGDFTEITAGMFALYFPHEAHRPCVAVKPDEYVKKIVVKVKW